MSPLLLPSEPQVPKKDFEAMRKQLHRRGEELDQKKRLQMSSDGETFDQVLSEVLACSLKKQTKQQNNKTA